MSLLLRHLTALRSGTRAWFHRYPTLRCSRLRGHCRTRGLASRQPLGSFIVAGRFLSVAVGAACYALLSPPLAGRSGRVRCSALLGRGGALRFRGLLAFSTWPGTWATSLKILSLGSPAWDVVVSPFTDVFAGFRLRVLAVGAGELAFLDWGSPDLAFLRCVWRAITKVDSKVRSLDSPACAGWCGVCSGNGVGVG